MIRMPPTESVAASTKSSDPADPGDLPADDDFAVHLPGQIDLDRGVHRHQPLDARPATAASAPRWTGRHPRPDSRGRSASASVSRADRATRSPAARRSRRPRSKRSTIASVPMPTNRNRVDAFFGQRSDDRLGHAADAELQHRTVRQQGQGHGERSPGDVVGLATSDRSGSGSSTAPGRPAPTRARWIGRRYAEAIRRLRRCTAWPS